MRSEVCSWTCAADSFAGPSPGPSTVSLQSFPQETEPRASVPHPTIVLRFPIPVASPRTSPDRLAAAFLHVETHPVPLHRLDRPPEAPGSKGLIPTACSDGRPDSRPIGTPTGRLHRTQEAGMRPAIRCLSSRLSPHLKNGSKAVPVSRCQRNARR